MRFVGFASKNELSQRPAGNETNNSNHFVVRQTDRFRIDIMNCGIKKKAKSKHGNNCSKPSDPIHQRTMDLGQPKVDT